MIDLLNVYDCPKCGERLSDQVSFTEIIDTVSDDVYSIVVCDDCFLEVKPRIHVTKKGQKVHEMKRVSHERFLWANGYYDEDKI